MLAHVVGCDYIGHTGDAVWNTLSREAKTRFAEDTSLAASGEKVVVTKHGKPFVEIVAVSPATGISRDQLDAARRSLNLSDRDVGWFDPYISNPDASRRLLGLDE